MYSERDLTNEIRKELAARVVSGRVHDPLWVCAAVLNNHPFPSKSADWKSPDDRDLWYLSGYGFVRALVRKLTGEFKEQSLRGIATQQPGFKFLQSVYLIDRKGRQKLVPLKKMIHAEGLAKYYEIRAMARGCDAHADELARYFGFTPGELGEAA